MVVSRLFLTFFIAIFPFVSLNTAFVAVSCLMTISAALQLSLVSPREWAALFGRVDRLKQKAVRHLSRTQSMFMSCEKPERKLYPRSLSMPEHVLGTICSWELESPSNEENEEKKKNA